MTNTCYFVQSVETPDDGQQICLKHAEYFIIINLRNSVLTFIIIHQDAQSSECQKKKCQTVYIIFYIFTYYCHLMMLSTIQIFIALHQQSNETANDVFRDNTHSGVCYFQNVIRCHRTHISVISLIPVTKVWPPSTALCRTETQKCVTA